LVQAWGWMAIKQDFLNMGLNGNYAGFSKLFKELAPILNIMRC
jgi:hypothetical protein